MNQKDFSGTKRSHVHANGRRFITNGTANHYNLLMAKSINTDVHASEQNSWSSLFPRS